MTLNSIKQRLKWAWAGLRGRGPIIKALDRLELLSLKIQLRYSELAIRESEAGFTAGRNTLEQTINVVAPKHTPPDYDYEIFIDRGKLPNQFANKAKGAPYIVSLDHRTTDEVLDAVYQELDTPKPRIVKVRRTVKRKKKAKKS